MSANITNVGVLILQTVFSVYVYILLLRLFFQKWGASWYNPICQFVIRTTEFVVKPIGRLVPGFKGVDLSIVLLAWGIEFVGTYITLWLKLGIFPGFLGVLLMSLGLLLGKVINVFVLAIVIAALASWFPVLQDNPIIDVVNLLSAPWMHWGRRYIPLIGGLDLSPLVVLLVLKLVDWLVFNPLVSFGLAVSLR